ncbi:MAG: YkgJ family cysteine cluster protein [Gammaproteobacteria bacterium]
MLDQQQMSRDAPFSYECRACRRCCHDKLIQLNPYEIARLARNRGISTGEFIDQYLSPGGPYLRFLENTACVFLTVRGCGVHPDRPLVCRLYPLGRHLSAEGVEHFTRMTPHPESEGIFGDTGTIADFLATQDITEFVDAADHYLELFYRLYDAMWQQEDLQTMDTDSLAETSGSVPEAVLREWLDLDAAIARYCSEHGLIEPAALPERLILHIKIIDSLLEMAKEPNS